MGPSHVLGIKLLLTHIVAVLIFQLLEKITLRKCRTHRGYIDMAPSLANENETSDDDTMENLDRPTFDFYFLKTFPHCAFSSVSWQL